MIKQWAKDIFGLFFPDQCVLCKNELVSEEKQICSSCLFSLPLTNFQNQKENALTDKLKGRVNFEQAAALYYFNTDSAVQDILHQIKYKDNEHLAVFMGTQMANQMKKSLAAIDFIIPVPLHKKKLSQRGYNQSLLLGNGIANTLNIPLGNEFIIRTKNTETQTNKTRKQRVENVKDAFEWKNSEMLKGKHLLLIDDVITTGATLESCILALPKDLNCKISILSLAAAIES